jgi:uncharacterized protein YndB with AHSA1/START domain
MTNPEKTIITVKALVNAPVEKVWEYWGEPQHIVRWNAASDDWHTPKAENDLQTGGRFLIRMEAKDGSFGFDFSGRYDKVEPHKRIEYTMDDNRKVQVDFALDGQSTLITESFEAESENPAELQQTGWQSILDNFKKYVEGLSTLQTLHFEIAINAPAEAVYQTMLDKKHYEEWTAEFNPTSRYEGSWEKGSKIVFLGTDEQGNVGGMVSRIKENIPNQFVSIEHLGIIQGDQEITSGSEIDGWAGALENYTFTSAGEKTLLKVDLDSNQEFMNYFIDTWPKALNKLKNICEQ